MQSLLDAGADVNATRRATNSSTDKPSTTTASNATSVSAASTTTTTSSPIENDGRAAEYSASQSPTLSETNDGYSALHIAAATNFKNGVQLLIERGSQRCPPSLSLSTHALWQAPTLSWRMRVALPRTSLFQTQQSELTLGLS